jgi:acetyl esterase
MGLPCLPGATRLTPPSPIPPDPSSKQANRPRMEQEEEEGEVFLTAESRAFLDMAFPPGCPLQRDIPVEAGRANMEAAVRKLGGGYPSVRRVEDIKLRCLDGKGQFGIRVYWPSVPDDDGGGEQLPVLLYAHGGGWVKGSANTHDQLCRRLALGSDHVLVAVDYRLSPEARFPQALGDLEAAFDWIHKQSHMDPTRLSVAGDSAGGNLVAGLVVRLLNRGEALRAEHRVKKQALIYPVLDLTSSSGPSYQRYGEGGCGLSNASIRYYVESYLGGKGRADALAMHPEASPLFFEGPKVVELPATLLVSARADPLLSDAEVGGRAGGRDGDGGCGWLLGCLALQTRWNGAAKRRAKTSHLLSSHTCVQHTLTRRFLGIRGQAGGQRRPGAAQGVRGAGARLRHVLRRLPAGGGGDGQGYRGLSEAGPLS